MPTDAYKKQALQEFYRRNFRAFAQEQLKIPPLAGGALIPFQFTESQELAIQRAEHQLKTQGYIRGVCLKPRQSGFSTLWEAVLYWLASLNPNKSTLLVAADAKSTNAIFRMAVRFLEHVGNEVRPLVRWLNKEEIDFENPDRMTRALDPGLGSRMEFQTAKNALAGTGTTRQALHLSEVGKWSEDLIDDLTTSLMPSIQRLPGTVIVMESTAFEGGDYFREMCEMAEEAEEKRFKGHPTGDSEWFFHFAPWWVDVHKNSAPLIEGETLELDGAEKELARYAARGFPKEYPHLRIGAHEITKEQFKFRREEIKVLGSEKSWDQEYPKSPKAAFINRDNWAFDRRALIKGRTHIQPPREFVQIDNGPRLLGLKKSGNVVADEDYVAIWAHPQQGVAYDIGIDVAMGGEDGDWTTGVVLRRDNREQVAEYHKHILPLDAAMDFYWLGKIYNVAQLIVEMNIGPGMLVHADLESNKHYPYMYQWRNLERIGGALTSYGGWQTNEKSKHIMVGTTADKVLHEDCIIRSLVLWREMSLYVCIGEQRYRASRGHDDLVMSLMMAVMGGMQEGSVAPGESLAKQEQCAHSDRVFCVHCMPIGLHDPRAGGKVPLKSRVSQEVRELAGMR